MRQDNCVSLHWECNGGKHDCQKGCRTAALGYACLLSACAYCLLVLTVLADSKSWVASPVHYQIITSALSNPASYLPSKQFGQWLFNSKQPQGAQNEQGHHQTQPAQGVQTWSKVECRHSKLRASGWDQLAIQSLDGIVISMEEGSCWSFEVKSLLSVEMSLRLIVNFYGITTASSSILLGAFYHPPGTGSIPLNQLHHPPYLTHDLSSCVVTSIFQAERLNHSDLILDRCLTQLAQQPTRGESILDLVQTHRVLVSQVEVVSGIPGSDCDAIQFSVKSTKPTLIRHNRFTYDFKKADFDWFRDLLCEIPWNCCFLSGNIESAWNCFRDLLFTAADECIPIETQKEDVLVVRRD